MAQDVKSDPKVTHVAAGEGPSFWLLGDYYTMKVSSDETNGAFALFETLTPPDSPGPPPHFHTTDDEYFYVLEGVMEILDLTNNRTITAGAGSSVHIPSGAMHTFHNAGTTPARFVTMVTPGGFEKFFQEAGDPATDPSSPPPAGPPDIEKLVRLAEKHGCIIPPPPEQ